MVSKDCFLKAFVGQKTRIRPTAANLLDRVFLGQLDFRFRE
jgi:hypothetical protein